ncbi:MAG: family 43 glycosylhydrolase [Verrucomicrobiales bacterium]|nr:family 43 glycosylhydrolase [Verrucomicrobiales bacterium]
MPLPLFRLNRGAGSPCGVPAGNSARQGLNSPRGRGAHLVRGVLLATVALLPVTGQAADEGGFPYILPMSKPARPLSAAMERLYDDYSAPTPESNELYSTFKFTPLEGLDYHDGDGTISRRDPSKVIRANGRYYVWYTHRQTSTPPRGAELGTDTVPSTDWDLAEIWYATSEDGFHWEEQGVAVPRPPKPHPGWRSVSTTDILIWKGKYYLYYQGFLEMSGRRGDDCPVAVSVADSPDGPWEAMNRIVIPNGAPGEWDQHSIHDPYPLVYQGRIYLYYKSDFNNASPHVRGHGLAIADDPLGPFTKHPLNPIMNSGHETTLFPFRQGIAAFAIHNGLEHNTIQYAPDGVNFRIAAVSSLMPVAAGPYVPDAFTDTKDGRGITWGLCHITAVGPPDKRYSILARFDCDLSRDWDDPRMKQTDLFLKPEEYFSQGLWRNQRERIERANREALGE